MYSNRVAHEMVKDVFYQLAWQLCHRARAGVMLSKQMCGNDLFGTPEAPVVFSFLGFSPVEGARCPLTAHL
jgi:hypothetical protein